MTVSSNSHNVYTHSFRGEVVYVGCGNASRPYQLTHRSKAHQKFIDAHPSKITVEIVATYEDRVVAFEHERVLIETLRPKFNVLVKLSKEAQAEKEKVLRKLRRAVAKVDVKQVLADALTNLQVQGYQYFTAMHLNLELKRINSHVSNRTIMNLYPEFGLSVLGTNICIRDYKIRLLQREGNAELFADRKPTEPKDFCAQSEGNLTLSKCKACPYMKHCPMIASFFDKDGNPLEEAIDAKAHTTSYKADYSRAFKKSAGPEMLEAAFVRAETILNDEALHRVTELVKDSLKIGWSDSECQNMAKALILFGEVAHDPLVEQARKVMENWHRLRDIEVETSRNHKTQKIWRALYAFGRNGILVLKSGEPTEPGEKLKNAIRPKLTITQ